MDLESSKHQMIASTRTIYYCYMFRFEKKKKKKKKKKKETYLLAAKMQAILFEHNLQFYVIFTVFRNIHGFK